MLDVENMVRKLAVPLVQCTEMAIRLGANVCETRKPLGWQANEGALDVLLLNEAMGECIMTLKTFLSTAHLPTFPKQQRWKVEPLKLRIIGFIQEERML